jgi:predicted PhzF superfamily epimerase YddE/YHI9
MGRPSQIHVELNISRGQLTAARIGGFAVRIASGTLAF